MSKLREEIAYLLHSETMYMDYEECQEAAIKIEQIITREKIEFLKSAFRSGSPFADITKSIKELESQLNQQTP